MTSWNEYNLVDNAWVPVLTNNGGTAMLGLRDALVNAGNIRRINTGNTMLNLALLRLLGAILIRANAGRASAEVWQRQWDNGELDRKPIEEYLMEWEDRFNLLSSTRERFYQTERGALADSFPADDMFDLIYPPEERDPKFADLCSDYANDPTPRDKRPTRLEPAQAAQFLVAWQTFDGTGLQPGDDHYYTDSPTRRSARAPRGYMGQATLARYGAIWPEFPTLARTLLANTPPVDANGNPLTGPDDLPAWERLALRGEQIGSIASGIADQLTLQTRCVMLHETIESPTTIGTFRSGYGRTCVRDDRNMPEPHCIWTEQGIPATLPTGPYASSMPMWWHLAAALHGSKLPLALEWTWTLTDGQATVPVHWVASDYQHGHYAEEYERETITMPIALLHSTTLATILDRACMAVDAYARLDADLTGNRSDRDRNSARSNGASIIDTAMLQLLEQPMPGDAMFQQFAPILRALDTAGNDLAQRHPDRFGGESLSLYHDTLRDIASGARDNAEAIRPSSQRRGRPVMPIIRSEGNLPPHRFTSRTAAVNWLCANGWPKAQASALAVAIRNGTMAYGFRWSNPPSSKE